MEMPMPDPVLDPYAVGRQLAESLATMQWATSLVPVRWIHHVPEAAPADAWTVAMNVAHLVTYERCIGLPLLENLAQGGDGAGAIESPFEQSFFADSPNSKNDLNRSNAKSKARWSIRSSSSWWPSAS